MQNVFQKFAPEGKIFLVSRKNGHEKEKKKKKPTLKAALWSLQMLNTFSLLISREDSK